MPRVYEIRDNAKDSMLCGEKKINSQLSFTVIHFEIMVLKCVTEENKCEFDHSPVALQTLCFQRETHNQDEPVQRNKRSLCLAGFKCVQLHFVYYKPWSYSIH